MTQPSEYRAPRWLPGGHLQTIHAAKWMRPPYVAYWRERWETPDFDFIDLDWVDNSDHELKLDQQDEAPLVVLFHGLEGSSDSHYARSLMHATSKRGWRGVVVHFRGCSGELNRLPRAYHSGDSAEIDWILRRLRSTRGGAIYAVGVSLGGNALLKWLGEQGDRACSVITRAAAVSAPVDLAAAGDALGRGFNMIYTRNFLATMKAKTLAKMRRYPALCDKRLMLAARTLREFDNIITAPLHGFRDTDDYWARASSKPHLKNIAVPTLLLNARNDPFLPEAALPTHDELSSVVIAEFPHEGGHAGFVTGPFSGRHGWLARRVLAHADTAGT
ncbi:MAG TPA: hydrolase [Burkholderiales bacterium]|nr:hydrolase [Burkholderiales bacterium]